MICVWALYIFHSNSNPYNHVSITETQVPLLGSEFLTFLNFKLTYIVLEWTWKRTKWKFRFLEVKKAISLAGQKTTEKKFALWHKGIVTKVTYFARWKKLQYEYYLRQTRAAIQKYILSANKYSIPEHMVRWMQWWMYFWSIISSHPILIDSSFESKVFWTFNLSNRE